MLSEWVRWPTLRCPFCGGVLRNHEYSGTKPIVCPSCSARLQLANSQVDLTNVVAVAIAIGSSYLLGFRGLRLVFLSILLFAPAFLLFGFFYSRFVPPKFEAYPNENGDSNCGH